MAKKSEVTEPEFVRPRRRVGKIPKWAWNMKDLGALLMPPRYREAITKALRMPGNPGRSADGRYEVGAWQEFMANIPVAAWKVDGNEPAESTGDTKRDLEIEKLRLNNKKLTFDLELRNKNFTANDQIERWVSESVMNARRVLLGLPAKLAPTLTGRNEVDIETILKGAIHEALTQLAEGSWTDSTPDPSLPDPNSLPPASPTGNDEP